MYHHHSPNLASHEPCGKAPCQRTWRHGPSKEQEKVIHYLETLRPYQLLAQMICTAFSSITDILYRTDIVRPKVLEVEIDQLYATIVSFLKPLQEVNLSDKGVTENMEDWRTDIVQLCLLLEKTEKHVIMAASIYQKLPDSPRLFSNLFSNYITLEKQSKLLQEVKLQHAVSSSERVSIANLFPPVSLSQTQRRSLRMGNFLNGHEPLSREIVFSHFDHYSEGQRERYRIDGSNKWENILSHRMYIQGSSNDLQVAYSVVSND
ncbi:hypothetical protein L7F22_030982 [Adiantum nelumboides]|nr:hypothetical protein [Adiantum nelumboides]